MRDTTLLRNIAANVRRLREKRGLTQAELAEQIDVELRHLQRIERGGANFGVITLAALGQALGVKVTALLKDAELSAARRGRPSARVRAK